MVDPTLTITIDDKVFVVQNLPAHVQALVKQLDYYRAELARINNEKWLLEAGIASLSGVIGSHLKSSDD